MAIEVSHLYKAFDKDWQDCVIQTNKHAKTEIPHSNSICKKWTAWATSWNGHCQVTIITFTIIIKIINIKFSSLVIGLKNADFPLIHLQVVIEKFVIRKFNLPITFKIVVHVTIRITIYASFVSLFMQMFPLFRNLAILLFSENVTFMIYW